MSMKLLEPEDLTFMYTDKQDEPRIEDLSYYYLDPAWHSWRVSFEGKGLRRNEEHFCTAALSS
jgi:hypothetical protein